MPDAMTNGFDEKITRQFVNDIERIEADIESRKGEYMAWCKGQRELIKDYVERAKDAGIPKRDLKAVLQSRKLERRIDRIRSDLDDGGETFDMIVDALGDFADSPLGAAAVEKASKKDTSAVDSLAFGDAANSNAQKLKEGIQPLQ